jgi:HlyD family secretion protein
MTDSARSPVKKKRIRLIILAVLVLAGIAIKLIFFQGTFRYAGTLEATKVDLSAQVASTIRAVHVREGDSVTEGQKLIELSCEDIRVADELATENYNRNFRLFRAGTASQETLDQMKNRKQDADVRLGWCDIRSPIRGTVLSRYHEPGEWMNPGTKLLTLANIQDIWAYIYVAQPEVSQLKPGMKLKAYLPEMKDRLFEGTILKVNEEAEFTPKNVQTRSERQRLVFGVKVSFLGSNTQEILKPGMTIEVELPKE